MISKGMTNSYPKTWVQVWPTKVHTRVHIGPNPIYETHNGLIVASLLQEPTKRYPQPTKQTKNG
jgi:hypothetical protein